jgi:cytochrome P450
MSTVTDVPIEDPQFYLDDPWPTFEWMQRDAPFWYYEPLDTFVLTRYDDIKAVAGLPQVFVSSRGLFLNDLKFQAQAGDELMTDRFFPKGGEQVGTTDPPRHRELRRVIAPAFTEEALDRLRSRSIHTLPSCSMGSRPERSSTGSRTPASSRSLRGRI